ncbi:hypothetical protein BDZ91DRAFT_716894 [Kalaharituber pfeilii]|nr:hypothetical protein BDZ91DRAFT_716894 [Kalaharituber pfeilii]
MAEQRITEQWMAEQRVMEVSRVGGASARDLACLELSGADEKRRKNEFIRDLLEIRRRLLEEPNTNSGCFAMRTAMEKAQVRYYDGPENNKPHESWVGVYQNRELDGRLRLLGLRASRRGVPARHADGSYSLIIGLDTLVALLEFYGINE